MDFSSWYQKRHGWGWAQPRSANPKQWPDGREVRGVPDRGRINGVPLYCHRNQNSAGTIRKDSRNRSFPAPCFRRLRMDSRIPPLGAGFIEATRRTSCVARCFMSHPAPRGGFFCSRPDQVTRGLGGQPGNAVPLSGRSRFRLTNPSSAIGSPNRIPSTPHRFLQLANLGLPCLTLLL